MDCPVCFAGYRRDRKDMEWNLTILSPFGTYYLNGLRFHFAKRATGDQTEFTASIVEPSTIVTSWTTFP